ncbi:MAG: hypothetical protein QXE10_04800 [Desulfurococcaceae archaeon]|jgi:hypothetical protein
MEAENMKAQYRRKLIDSIENTIGDIVNELIDKYYGDRIETEYDYEKILYSIAHQVKQEVFDNKAALNDVIEYLNKLRNKKSIAKLIISYMISRALEEPE